MKRNTKITIAAFCTMFVMAIAVSVLAFSYASRSDGSATFTDAQQYVFADINDDYTNIDNIIANSYATGTDADPVYHIVEIYSGDTPSSLGDYINDGRFEEFVLNEYSTKYTKAKDSLGNDIDVLRTMNPNQIEYLCYSASEFGYVDDIDPDNLDATTKLIKEKLAKVSNADFIYLSNDANLEFSSQNDISEDLYNILHVYSVGSYKPLVIDGPKATTADVPSSGQQYTMTSLTDEYFTPLGSNHYTFAWNQSLSTVDFLSHRNGSMYLGINSVKFNRKIHWETVRDNADENAADLKEYNVAKILTVSKNDTSVMTDKLLADATVVTDARYDLNGDEIVDRKFYNIAGTIMESKGYNTRYGAPDYVEVDKALLADFGTLTNLDDYDLVVLESDCKGELLSYETYNALISAMYGNKSIIYDAAFAGAAPVIDDNSDDSDGKSSNYLELYHMVATSEGDPRYSNIMITTRNKFGAITSSTTKGTGRVIAELINASAFRGIGGPNSGGSSSSMFTVLEIQPCYPIDRELAEKLGTDVKRGNNNKFTLADGSTDQGNYYIHPADVINGKTKEQIAEDTEYYAWELSEAKIADALDLDVNQINLIHMSSEELAANKADIYGNIDLIYIGGNISAIKSAEEYYAFLGMRGYINPGENIYRDLNQSMDNLAKVPVYSMYSHNGDFTTTNINHVVTAGTWKGKTSGLIPTGTVQIEGRNVNTFSILNGNDITYNNLKDLEKYVNSGLPVVISEKVAAAYDLSLDAEDKSTKIKNPYLQNSLDPDCNMYKFLTACKSSTKSNVLWGFNQDAVVDRDNDGGRLGTTLTGFVSVFASSNGDVSASSGDTITGQKDLLQNIYMTAYKRPKMTVTNRPATYNMYDPKTKLSNHELKFEYRLSGTSNYKVSLYIDDDGNSKFRRADVYDANGKVTEASERVASVTNKTILTYKVASNFNGPLYWMLEAEDQNTGITVYTTGIAFIKSPDNEKQRVRVLEIMPGEKGNSVNGGMMVGGDTPRYNLGEGPGGLNTLYFCTECQKAYQRLEYNACFAENGGFRNRTINFYDGKYTDFVNGMFQGKFYLGKHEHRFGIVPYDSNLLTAEQGGKGMDDWNKNLADEVSDLYEFDLDIMLREELEEMSDKVRSVYSEDIAKMTAQEKQDKINNYVSEDADFDKLSDDEKLVIILQAEYTQTAEKYWQLYKHMRDENYDPAAEVKDINGTVITTTTKDAEEVFREAIKGIINGIPAGDTITNYDIVNGGTTVSARSEYQRLLDTRLYADYYSIKGGTIDYKYNGKTYDEYFAEYIAIKDKEIEYLEKYKEYSRYAAGKYWLEDCYDCVILGASEEFAFDDITNDNALDDLERYVANDNNTLFFHDTLTRFSNEGSSKLTERLRVYFGLDRYDGIKVGTKTDASGNEVSLANANTYYMPYTNSSNPDKYFMMNLSYKDKNDTSRFESWRADFGTPVGKWNDYVPKAYLSNTAYSDVLLCTADSSLRVLPYRYAEMKWNLIALWRSDAKFSPYTVKKYGTDKASQNNVGIVTLYPFTLSSELNISPTHNQAYAANLEDDDMSVWYSMAGGTNHKLVPGIQAEDSNSSLYAASPRDGMDAYFIYSYGNISYCGAGHGKITGVGTDNNDERRLYINIICNSVRKSIAQPNIEIYDYMSDSCGNKIKLSETEGYYTKVVDNTDYTDFNFKVMVDKSTTLSAVKIYFDLDYNGSTTSFTSGTDKMIADWNRADNPDKVEESKNVPVFRYDKDLLARYDSSGNEIPAVYYDETGTKHDTHETMLQLQPEYFEKYDGNYTYIVIEAKDSKGNIVRQRLKIILKDKLFKLT